MEYLIKPNGDGLFAERKNGQAMVSSLTVAEVFEKEHKNVMQSIEKLKEDAVKTAVNSENLAAENSAAKLSTDVDKMFVHKKTADNGRIQSAEFSADYSKDINDMFVQNVYKHENRDVLEAIKNLDCSEEFSLRNFAESKYKNWRDKDGEMPEV